MWLLHRAHLGKFNVWWLIDRAHLQLNFIFSYTSPEGQVISLTYAADDVGGFQPQVNFTFAYLRINKINGTNQKWKRPKKIKKTE